MGVLKGLKCGVGVWGGQGACESQAQDSLTAGVVTGVLAGANHTHGLTRCVYVQRAWHT